MNEGNKSIFAELDMIRGSTGDRLRFYEQQNLNQQFHSDMTCVSILKIWL